MEYTGAHKDVFTALEPRLDIMANITGSPVPIVRPAAAAVAGSHAAAG